MSMRHAASVRYKLTLEQNAPKLADGDGESQTVTTLKNNYHTWASSTVGGPELPRMTSVAISTCRFFCSQPFNPRDSSFFRCSGLETNSAAAHVPQLPIPATITTGCSVWGS